MLLWKTGPLEKHEVYYVEEDFFKNANIEIADAPLKVIEDEWKTVVLENKKEYVYDRILLASGSIREKFKKNQSNVITISDYDSHAQAHN